MRVEKLKEALKLISKALGPNKVLDKIDKTEVLE